MSTASDLHHEILAYLAGRRNGPYEHELACHRLRKLSVDERRGILLHLLDLNAVSAVIHLGPTG